MKKNNTLLGAHISAAQSLDKAIDRAEDIHANCMQIFTKSNRQWKAKKISAPEAATFIDKQKKSNIQIVVAHAAYIINLGSASDEVVQKSIKSLSEELQRCEQLKIPYLVLHPGTARYSNIEKSLQFIAKNIDLALQESKTKKVMLLIETMAGQGKTLGYTFEQIASIIKHLKHKHRVGVCFDTCHVFASGYKFDTPVLYKKLWEHFDKIIGLKQLKVLHVNDSKKECNSRVDRHEDIGKGKISPRAFQLLMQDQKFKNIPKILETPKENEQDDIENMQKLIHLMKK